MSNNFKPKEAIGIDPTSSPKIISDNCRIEKGDIRNSSFESGYFDVIISNFAFEHILNLDVALSEMYRLLNKGDICMHNGDPFGQHLMGIIYGILHQKVLKLTIIIMLFYLLFVIY